MNTRPLNYGAIAAVVITAGAHLCINGDLPLWWWGYGAGVILTAGANILFAEKPDV